MDEAALFSAFELLDDFLTVGKSSPVWLVVGGGGALLVHRLSTRQTKDVDVMALREWAGNVVSAYPLPDALKHAAAKVAEELRLDPDGLNGAASLHGLDLPTLPSWFWQELDTREYGSHLKISFIGRKGLTLLKLSAALDRDQRRDVEDLTCLNPSSAEVEELLHWVLSNIHETSTHPKLPSLLHELGHADLIPGFS
jgi:hypothetical protein